MKRLGLLGVCLLAMAAPAAGGAQQPPPPDSQDSNAAEQAADPASENGATEAAPAAAHEIAPAPAGADAPVAPDRLDTQLADRCLPKRMIGRKYGPPYISSLPDVPAHAPATGAFGDIPPSDPDHTDYCGGS